MYLLGLGIVLLLMKYLEVDPVAAWSWWTVLAPFGLAAVWWVWADMSGYTKRKAMEKMDQKKKDRIEKQREALGMKPGKRR
ncbi:TIGR04438 family Trp-rich protein [Hydrogenophaga sp. XSHU_21]